jgi:AcrR family transcriptional regulator
LVLAVLANRSLTAKGRRARARILLAAEPLFATRGFHGASMRDVAAAAGFPLATVVYHFAKKQQLYAAVLAAIGGDLEVAIDTAVRGGDPRARVRGFAAALVGWMLRYPQRVRLLLRELLDNPVRVARASHLPLAAFLVRAAEVVGEARAAGVLDLEVPELAVLHVVGGISYVIAARPTLERIGRRTAGRGIPRHAARYERDAVAFACRVLGVTSHQEPSHASRPAAPARPSRARSPRAQDHRRRRKVVDLAGRELPRSRGSRARADAAVPRAAARGRPRVPARGAR